MFRFGFGRLGVGGTTGSSSFVGSRRIGGIVRWLGWAVEGECLGIRGWLRGWGSGIGIVGFFHGGIGGHTVVTCVGRCYVSIHCWLAPWEFDSWVERELDVLELGVEQFNDSRIVVN